MPRKTLAQIRADLDRIEGLHDNPATNGSAREAREKRSNIIADCRALTDRASEEKRDLTDEEYRLHERLISEAQRWADKIEKITDDMERQLRTVRSDADRRFGRAGGTGRGPIFELQDGRQIRSLLPSDRLTAEEERTDDGERRADFGRALTAMVTGRWHDAEPEQRAMGQAGNGGFLVQPILAGQVIDIARNAARVVQAGAITIPMDTSQVAFARVLGDPTAGWKAENAAIGASDMTFGRANLNANTLVAMVKMSVELFEDAPNAGQIAMTALGEALGLELDRAALLGNGVNMPLGIANDAEVQKVTDLGANGGPIAGYAPFSRAWQKVQEKNGPGDGLGIIGAPRMYGDLDRLTDANGNPLVAPESWGKMAKYSTAQVPTNQTQGTSTDCTTAFVGQWAALWIGMRTDLTIEISRQAADTSGGSAFNNLQVWIRAYMRADTLISRSERFVTIPGIRPGS